METFMSLVFTSLSNDLPIMMSPTTIKLVLRCLWYRKTSVNTNVFSDCRNSIALKPINLRLWPQNAPQTKPSRGIRLPWQAPAASRLFEGARQPWRHYWQWCGVKWYVTTIINMYMTSLSVCLWKTVQHHQDYLSRLIKFRTQYNTKTGLQTDDVWHILWRQHEHEAVVTGFAQRPYVTP